MTKQAKWFFTNTMVVWVASALLLMRNCSAPTLLPWVQQWRSKAFSSAKKELIFPNPKLTTFSCWVLAQTTQHYPHNHSPPLLAQEAYLP
jgi:hypothetical protein